MDEHYCWYNGSVWHIDWPHQVYVGQWELTINIILGRNHLTKYGCCSMWHACAHMIPPELKHTFVKMAGNSACSTRSVDSLEQFSFSTICNLQLFDLTLTEERKLSWRTFYWWYAEICYLPRIAWIWVFCLSPTYEMWLAWENIFMGCKIH